MLSSCFHFWWFCWQLTKPCLQRRRRNVNNFEQRPRCRDIQVSTGIRFTFMHAYNDDQVGQTLTGGLYMNACPSVFYCDRCCRTRERKWLARLFFQKLCHIFWLCRPAWMVFIQQRRVDIEETIPSYLSARSVPDPEWTFIKDKGKHVFHLYFCNVVWWTCRFQIYVKSFNTTGAYVFESK